MLISAKDKTNIDELVQAILDVSDNKLQLQEDYSTLAQCYVIETKIDEDTNLIYATVLVKRGTLRLDDIFLCGTYEGKVLTIKSDTDNHKTEAYPGEAV